MVSFYNEAKRKKGRFITVVLNENWYKCFFTIFNKRR